MLFRTAGFQPAHDHEAGWKPAVRKKLLPGAVLAPQVELLLHRAVGEGEQHRVTLGAVLDLGPARHDEVVALLPAESLVADHALARALDHREHRAVGAAIG